MRKEGHRKKQRGRGKALTIRRPITHWQDSPCPGVSPGQAHLPIISQHRDARKAPPSQPGPSALETSGPVESPGPPIIVPGRKLRPREGQGLAQGYGAEVARPQVSWLPEQGSSHAPAHCTHQHPTTPAHHQPQHNPARASDTYF